MDASLASKLDEIVAAYEENLARMADPDVASDQAKYTEVARRHAELKAVVDTYQQYREAETEAAEAAELSAAEDDPEMVAYLRDVAQQRQAELDPLEEQLRLLLVPKDPNDEKNVIMEIRSAAGGDEAALWAGDLFRMFERYAERHGWVIDPIGVSESEGGGLKEAIFEVKGHGAYSRLKFEAGTHRVQRVPKTESQGRIHTSVATVAVLPEAEEVDVEINESDLIVETMRSQGPGGQSVNTTDSAVRITHRPTNLVVSCQDEKSQLQNKIKAMRVLRARLLQIQIDEQMGERSAERRQQVGSGERAEKIRTYNFKENRVTDHRVGLTLHSLPAVLEGDLDEFHEALMADEQARRLAAAES